MYVCHCGVVTDREIRAAIDGGARDVCAVAERCGAAVRCGGCVPAVCELLAAAGIACPAVSVRQIRAELRRRGIPLPAAS